MVSYVLKTLLSAVVIVLASEVGKRSTAMGALIIALPLNSILAFSLLYVDTRDGARVAAMSQSVLILIVPSLLFFGLLPLGVRLGLGYPAALGLSAGATVLVSWGWLALLKAFGVAL
jgi:hypothetical protein